MANIRYRGSTVPTDVNAAGGKSAALTNTEIDQNFFALDRDKLDKGTAYSSTVQTVAGPVTFSNNIVISGSLTVGGTTTTVNSTVVSIADINIELARNATTAAQANGAGITITGPTTAATLTYTSADDRWNFNKNLNVGTVHGALSGNASTATTLQTARTINGVSFDGSANISFTTNAVAEGNANLYYTDARARGALSFVAGSGAYNSSTGVITIPTNTSQLTNGANFITLGSISATAPVSYSNGVISMPAATATANGYMTSTYASKLDGIAANATNVTNTNQLTNGAAFIKLDSISASAPISYNNTNGVISISAATQSAAGSMSATDKTKLDGIAVNATNVTNTSQLTNGANFITLSSISATAPVSYSNTNGVISMPAATATANGYMTSTYASKLDGIALNANNTTYSIKASNQAGGARIDLDSANPITQDSISFYGQNGISVFYQNEADIRLDLSLATSGARGGVQIGYTTDNTNRNYAVQLSSEKMYVNVPWTEPGNGTLSTAAVAAGLTNTTVSLNLSGAYSANTTTDRTINPVVGPAITNLAALMTSGNTGFIKRTGQDTYSIDTNTYLTSYTETDTLATVTARGASTSSNITLTGSTPITLTSASSNTITTGNGIPLTITTGSTGSSITIRPGQNTGGTNGYNVTVAAGNASAINVTGGTATITGGIATATAGGSGGNIIIAGGYANGTSGTKNGGNVYIDGGGATNGGTNNPGNVYIGTNAGSEYFTNIIQIGHSASTIRLQGLGTSGFVKLGANGALSADTNSYSVTGHTHAASDITSGTFAFARLPTLYIGTTAIQSSSASQALTGITTLTTTGNISIYSDGVAKLFIMQGAQGTGNTLFQNSGSTNNGFAFTNANGTLLTVSSSGDTTATGNVTAYSDARLKTNVKTLENSLEKTLKLRGVSYQKDGKDGVGVIAQEIREVLPEVVIEGDDQEKTLSVAYGNVVGLLIEAIKELNAKVEDLQKQLSNK